MKIDQDSFKGTLSTPDGDLKIISLEKVAETYPNINHLPFSIRISKVSGYVTKVYVDDNQLVHTPFRFR